ncbi:MAG: hypothetical protein HYY01_14260 [Chloroflexi bacterium]|nr:hypothetical protein [Chloroflexota bacterium]
MRATYDGEGVEVEWDPSIEAMYLGAPIEYEVYSNGVSVGSTDSPPFRHLSGRTGDQYTVVARAPDPYPVDIAYKDTHPTISGFGKEALWFVNVTGEWGFDMDKYWDFGGFEGRSSEDVRVPVAHLSRLQTIALQEVEGKVKSTLFSTLDDIEPGSGYGGAGFWTDQVLGLALDPSSSTSARTTTPPSPAPRPSGPGPPVRRCWRTWP